MSSREGCSCCTTQTRRAWCTPSRPPATHRELWKTRSTRQRKSEVLGVYLQHPRELDLLSGLLHIHLCGTAVMSTVHLSRPAMLKGAFSFLPKYVIMKSKPCSCYFLLLIFLGLACLSPVSIKNRSIHSYQWFSWGGFYRWNRGAGFARNAALKSSEYFWGKTSSSDLTVETPRGVC